MDGKTTESVEKGKKYNMTECTKKALEIISPMAKELNIDVKADESLLYLNGQAIGIACNSAYATIMEFIGYVFAKEFIKRSTSRPYSYIRDVVKRYWLTEDQLNKVLEHRKNERVEG